MVGTRKNGSERDSERQGRRLLFFSSLSLSLTLSFSLSKNQREQNALARFLSPLLRLRNRATSIVSIMETSSSPPSPLKIIGERERERYKDRKRNEEKTNINRGQAVDRSRGSNPSETLSTPRPPVASAPYFHPRFLPGIEDLFFVLIEKTERQITSSSHRETPNHKKQLQLASPTPSASFPSTRPLLLPLSRPTPPSPPSRRPARRPSAPAANGWPCRHRTG